MIFYDSAHEKKSSRFIFHDIYLKENKIKNLQQYVEDKKNINKILRSLINDFRILKKTHNTRRKL